MTIQKSFHIDKKLGSLALAALLGAASFAASAQQQQAPSSAQAMANAAEQPKVQTQNGISYVTGGIGDSGQQSVKALGKDMNLQLVFAKAAGGNYVAKVDVSIAEKGGGKVLDVKGADPLLFAQLKPGTYVVTATPPQGKSVERTVNVPAKGQHTETFAW